MIDNFKQNYTLAIAPMEGVSDFPFRLWINLISGPLLNGTPFYRVTEGCMNRPIPKEWLPEKLFSHENLPYKTLPQLMGDSTEVINNVASRLNPLVDFIDVNFGCPSKKVVGRGSGSSLLKDLDYFEKFLEQLCDSANNYSIKIRTGFDDDLQFEKMIDIIGKFPLKQLTVHGRTKAQSYKGFADWKRIKYASEMLKIPVIGSGDVISAVSFQERINIAPKVSGVIIGRGVMRNPWIFDEIKNSKNVEIDLSIIPFVLSTFAVLSNLFFYDFGRLNQLYSEQFFDQCLGNDKLLWQSFTNKLHLELYEKNFQIENIVVDSRTMGRVKLIWHNFRTSLPEEFFEPMLMRSKNLKELVDAIEKISADYKAKNQNKLVTLTLV